MTRVAVEELVHPFHTSCEPDVLVLGGKGSGLVRMARLGLPVPAGFVVPTSACARTLAESGLTAELLGAILVQVDAVGEAVGRRFGDPQDPLLLSVRSGAPVSMPGMMDTVLNLGLNDELLPALERQAGRAFALDTYTRLIRSFASTVREVPPTSLPPVSREGEAGKLRELSELLAAVEHISGEPFPQEPHQQLVEAVLAVFRSWTSPRAVRYRKHRGIPEELGTAVVVQAMVFGNTGPTSGTGVAFTRDPATGAPGMYGDFLADAQGEDLVSGEFEGTPLEEYDGSVAPAIAQLRELAVLLEREYTDMLDIEFTVERGTLFVLQVRPGQRSAAAAVRIALDLVDEGLITPQQALQRVSPEALVRSTEPALALDPDAVLLGVGTPASPGGAVGMVALTSSAAEQFADDGEDVILVRPSTSPEDIAGMLAARGVLTQSGGRTSHAAVVARGLGRPAVCAVAGLVCHADHVEFDGIAVQEGGLVSIDGSTGAVYLGAVGRETPPPDERLERLLTMSDSSRILPLLSVEGPARWGDGELALGDVWRVPEDVVPVARGDRVVVELGDPDVLVPMTRAASDAAASGGELVLLVDRRWPASLKGLPDVGWHALAATEAGSAAARLLAGRP
jgi:pyruvate,orthophosphate dikinase